MSYKNTPVFHHRSTGWDATTRSHPAMKWMEHYTTTAIDKREFMSDSANPSNYFTPDATLVTSAGVTVTGTKEKFVELARIYGPFVAHYHEPQELFCYEMEDGKGWEMMGRADVYVEVPKGQGKHDGGSQGEKVKSGDGREWDAMMPSAFRFEYVKDGEEIRLRKSEIFSDPMPALGLLLKRGVVKPEDLLK